jgi:simple sugar transport system ATP-binding protein
VKDLTKVVEMKNIVKRFPGVLANDHINFEVEKGEIHALLGENGAGKTTLMNILYGLYKPDEGEIYVKGKKVEIKSPLDSIKLGIGMVHQHFMLVPPLTVTENIILGLKSSRGPLLDIPQAEKRISELSEKYGLKVDPKAKIWQLPVGHQQRVEILKALYRGADILILDEPTAVLTPLEVRELFKILKSMKEHGNSIIFITHKLDEVMAIADRVTVLRAGKVVSTVNKDQTNKVELAKMMVGREVLFRLEKAPPKIGKAVLEVEGLKALNDKGLLALKGISFKVHKGEIFGIAGVAGNGQTELAQVITGLRKAISGRVIINGKDVTNKPPKEIIKQKTAYIPEDRMRLGLIRDFSVAENLILKIHDTPPIANGFFLNFSEIGAFSERLIKEFNIVTPSKDVAAAKLSGGNLQKLLLARELSLNPELIIAEQPTRGLDVGATEYIRKKLLEERDRGAAVLLISYELDEVLSLSDRIAVMYEGEIMGIVKPEEVTIEEIGMMMAGSKLSEVKAIAK